MIANTVWTLITAMLVFWMNAGFATLEAGLCRRKNAVNILAKNFIVFAISSIAFWVVGFGLMFNEGNNFIGTSVFMSGLQSNAEGLFSTLSWTNVPLTVKFFFQLVFAGTAATIVSGAVAERIKFIDFIIFSFLLIMFVYPVTGHWAWGGGWLADHLYHDFAGSSVVHACGGGAALAGAMILGPRIGKYRADGSVNPIPGHNMGLASLGCLILWLGWFGFNPGSTMTADKFIGHIAVTTNTAAAFGTLSATITAWLVLGKPDLSMILNGCLAGLVAITAPCAAVTVPAAAIIGTIAGVIVVFSVLFWDKIRVDDPVGAISVHLVNGIWGILSVGLFAHPDILKQWVNSTGEYCRAGLFNGGGAAQLGWQALGVFAIAGTSFGASMVFWYLLKLILGIRVSAAEEVEGLDIGEHGMEAYPGFAVDVGTSGDTTAV
ncbi:MAG TPA: ammonium transporter [Tepidisphaeraceae bacterium]|nr:ammonium transporter [Tepidisphaeraceae bacterium]